jgi:hypothetical protein
MLSHRFSSEFFLVRASGHTPGSKDRNSVAIAGGGPMVRIHFPPAASLRTIGTAVEVFALAGSRIRLIRSEALNVHIDLTPATIDTDNIDWASNTTLDDGCDLYVANRGDNTIVRLRQDGSVVGIRRVKLGGRHLEARLNGIASSPDGSKIYATFTGPREEQGGVRRHNLAETRGGRGRLASLGWYISSHANRLFSLPTQTGYFLFPRKPAIFASAIDETGGRSSPIKKRSGGCSLCARRRQAPALITVFGPASTPLALQRLVGKFVGLMPSPCACTAFKLVSRCEDARPEGDQRGANSASPRTHGSVRTRASGDPDAVGNPEGYANDRPTSQRQLR